MKDNKIITEEILWERLEAKGIQLPSDVNNEDAIKAVLDHWAASVTAEDDGKCSMKFYRDSTADGYEVHVVQYGTGWNNGISISENVYYYSNGWLKEMPNAIKDGADIYFEDLDDDPYDFYDIIHELYEQYHDYVTTEMEDQLINEGWVLENKEIDA